MAIGHLSAKIVTRSTGGSVIAAAAYRSRSMLRDERKQEWQDYRPISKDLIFEGIFAPKNAPEWARDRTQLWNHVEHFEKNKNAQLAREIEIALPHELTDEQNRLLLTDWVRENISRKGYIADVAMHAPHEWGDDRNKHAHVLVTMRKIDGNDFEAKKRQIGKDYNPEKELVQWRANWERIANRKLEQYGHEARIDMSSFESRGLNREPTIHMGKTAAALERDGITTDRGDTNRAAAARNREIEELERVYALRQEEHQQRRQTEDRQKEAEHLAIRQAIRQQYDHELDPEQKARAFQYAVEKTKQRHLKADRESRADQVDNLIQKLEGTIARREVFSEGAYLPHEQPRENAIQQQPRQVREEIAPAIERPRLQAAAAPKQDLVRDRDPLDTTSSQELVRVAAAVVTARPMRPAVRFAGKMADKVANAVIGVVGKMADLFSGILDFEPTRKPPPAASPAGRPTKAESESGRVMELPPQPQIQYTRPLVAEPIRVEPTLTREPEPIALVPEKAIPEKTIAQQLLERGQQIKAQEAQQELEQLLSRSRELERKRQQGGPA